MNYEYTDGLVSVVTPVYNGEGHLAGMLDSVLRQTYPQIEVILVDDGSVDGTVRVAESYCEKFEERGYGFRLVRAEHGNASAAVNKGLPFVSGEYLIWPDSDDVLEPESVERRVEFLRENPQYACVRSLSYYFNAETGERGEKADEQRGDLDKEDLFWDILESKTFVCCGCYMLRAESFFAVYPDRRIPEYGVGQNFQMLLPFMYCHKCPTIKEELYGVAVRDGSHSRTPLTQEQEEQKYRDYERLVDDIARICARLDVVYPAMGECDARCADGGRIRDQQSKNRIICWKARRRYKIALKYRRRKDALRALGWLNRCGGFSAGDAVKEIIWLYFVKGWMKEKIYPVYQKLAGRK